MVRVFEELRTKVKTSKKRSELVESYFPFWVQKTLGSKLRPKVLEKLKKTNQKAFDSKFD